LGKTVQVIPSHITDEIKKPVQILGKLKLWYCYHRNWQELSVILSPALYWNCKTIKWDLGEHNAIVIHLTSLFICSWRIKNQNQHNTV
jgi:CTP synthase